MCICYFVISMSAISVAECGKYFQWFQWQYYFAISVAECVREFSSVVSCKLYDIFVLVRDSGLCLFAEKSLRRINQNLAEANCIKASGS